MRRLARILLWTAGAVLSLILLVGIVVETPMFKRWLRGMIVRQANDHLNGTLAIGQFRGNLLTGAELDDVVLTMDNERVASIDAVKVHYSIPRLIHGGTTVDSVAIVHPVVAVHRNGNTWQLARLVKPSKTTSKSTRPIAVRHIVISNGSVTVDKASGQQSVDIPEKIDDVNTSLSFAYVPDHSTTVDVDAMSFGASNPAFELRQASGQVAVTGNSINISNLTVRTGESALWADGAVADYRGSTPTFALQASLTPISLPEIHRLVPAMKDMNVAPTVNVKLGGPTSRLAAEVSAQSNAGDFAFKGTVSLGGPDRVYQGEAAVHHLDLAPFLNNTEQKSDINVYAKVNVRGPAGFDTLKGSVAADAPLISTHGYVVEGIRANTVIDGRTIRFETSELAYKSNVTSAGSVTFATDQRPETRFDFRGVFKDVGIAYLPKSLHVPPATTKLTASYHVNLVLPRRPGWHLEGDVTLAKSTVSGVTIDDGAKATFAFGPNLAKYSADMSVSDVDLQQIGTQFDVASLANPRYKTSLNGHINASVAGTALATMSIHATGTLNDSRVFGGRLDHTTFDSTLSNDALHVKATAQLDKINPAVVADKGSLGGSVSGNVDADLTLRHLSKGTDLDSIEGTVTADLGPSSVGQATIDRAFVSGEYQHSFADIYQIEVEGSDVVAQGNGTIAFNDTDQSGFWIHAETQHLEEVNNALNSGHMLRGIGTVDAVVSGNKKQFVANGTVTANGLKFDGYGALATTSKITATIPNLAIEEAAVNADTHATFVDLPGLQVNDLTVKTNYQNKNVDFDLTATQPKRSLTTTGSLILHPDHNEVHLTALKFDTQGMTWQIGQGHSPALQWSGDAIIVKDVDLVNGQQEIHADGSFGSPDESLTLNVKDVDLGIVDAWLLRPPQLAGTVNAKAVLRGSKDAPQADLDFTVANGKFRQVAYQSITGKARYTPANINLDTRLQQSDANWIAAKGDLPMSLFKGKKSASDRIDFHVDSSTVDLGIIQGVTDAITGVTGTLQARLDMTGTSENPRVQGGLTVHGGGMKVEDTSVTYQGLDGTIDFQPDRVHIDDLHVLDHDNDYLSVTGDLGVSGLRVSAVNLGVYADNFKVLGNEMGDLHINSNIELTGTLAHPKIQGDLGVNTGSIKLDPILARVSDNAYSTQSIDVTKAGTSEANARQGLLGNLELGLHVTIPDDLVVKADDLRVGAAPIGLGKVNITLGGNLNLAAAPGRPITLVGDVNTIRGFYDYQGRRFTILRDGKVRFEGERIDQLDPRLDVSAERMIQAVTVRVNVKGRMRKPQIELTSVPPQDQADILALIIFNQPLNQLGEGQQLSLAQRAGSIAAGAVTNQLTGSIANSLNLDQLEVNLSPDTGSAAELTVGQQLGQNLYVKVQQGIGENSQTNFVLEYEFNKWMRLQTNVLEGATTEQQLFQRVKSTGADLVFTFQFK